VVVKAFFAVPVIVPVRICNMCELVCMLNAVRGLTVPMALPPTAPLLYEILPKLTTGNCVVPCENAESPITCWNEVPPVPDFLNLKVWPVVRSAIVAVPVVGR